MKRIINHSNISVAWPVTLVLWLAGVSEPACGGNDPPKWIWGTRDTTQFVADDSLSLRESPKRASLKCAVDFCTATVWLNDKIVCRMNGETNLKTVDVTSFLESGTNRIRLSAERTAGPAAVAYQLNIITPDGRDQSVQSSQGKSTSLNGDGSTPHDYGSVQDEPWWNIQRSPSVSVFDEYNQWKEATADDMDRELASFQVADGFEIKRILTAKPEHGSWVSMELDEQGRVLLGKEDTGILRLTLAEEGHGEPVIETINNTLQGVHGLLLTEQGLIVSANRSRGLYRLNRSTDGRSFGEVTLLQETEGSEGDHGRHDVVQDAAGKIYVIHGDSIQIPDRFSSFVPTTNEFRQRHNRPTDGHVIQTDVHGETWNVFCSGLRNPYGLALNRDGELFTYDADAERHTGLPWYRPTRIVHLMPGVDYGWRNPGLPWPGYLADTIPPIAAIGRGSPTSLKFAYESNFPPAYRNALIALDWSYGRILAVHVIPQGSTYLAQAEVLLRGRPFSVCDLDFATDGSMLVVTGGRKTQSTLYRVRYVGCDSVSEQHESQQVRDRNSYSAKMREQRRELESFFDQQGTQFVDRAWQQLDHADRGIRGASRILLEHQPPTMWQDRLWRETNPSVALTALLALTRTNNMDDFPQWARKLGSLPLETSVDLQTAVRIESLVDRQLAKDTIRSRAICDRFESHFPTGRRSIDRDLCRLLVDHESQTVVSRTLKLLADESDPIDRFHYLMCLADATRGWDPDRHDEFFRLLNGARLFITDEGLDDRLQELFEKAIRHVDQSQRSKYDALFAVDSKSGKPSSEPESEPLPLVNQWTVAQITRQLESLNRPANGERGAHAYKIANCGRCHRCGTTGISFGPDLTTVASRFSRQHILEQIVEPSKVISSQYRSHTIVLEDGRVLNGQVVYNGFRQSILQVATNPMSFTETTEINKDDIESFAESPVSPMPERLLDALSIEQIADLLAFLGT